jgi:hypothetical protein
MHRLQPRSAVEEVHHGVGRNEEKEGTAADKSNEEDEEENSDDSDADSDGDESDDSDDDDDEADDASDTSTSNSNQKQGKTSTRTTLIPVDAKGADLHFESQAEAGDFIGVSRVVFSQCKGKTGRVRELKSGRWFSIISIADDGVVKDWAKLAAAENVKHRTTAHQATCTGSGCIDDHRTERKPTHPTPTIVGNTTSSMPTRYDPVTGNYILAAGFKPADPLPVRKRGRPPHSKNRPIVAPAAVRSFAMIAPSAAKHVRRGHDHTSDEDTSSDGSVLSISLPAHPFHS